MGISIDQCFPAWSLETLRWSTFLLFPGIHSGQYQFLLEGSKTCPVPEHWTGSTVTDTRDPLQIPWASPAPHFVFGGPIGSWYEHPSVK